LALSVVSTLLYFSSYKKSFDSTKPLTTKLFEENAKAFEAAKHPHEHTDAEHAAPEKKVVVIDLKQPLLKKGFDLYTDTAGCVGCHGEKGEGIADLKAPLIAAQHDWYVQSQLQNMKSGVRKNEAMQPFVENLSEDDMKALAAYVTLLRVQ
jgi:cytochrome c553